MPLLPKSSRLGLRLLALAVVVLAWGSVWFVLREHRDGDSPLHPDGTASGWAAAWLGDVDGDGTPDFVLATGFEPGQDGRDGSTRVVSGRSGLVLQKLHEIAGGFVNHGDGLHALHAVTGAGDVDGDGRGETWVRTGDGRLLLVSGRTGAVLVTLEVGASRVLERIDDLDGDGVPDLIAGGFSADGRGGRDCERALCARRIAHPEPRLRVRPGRWPPRLARGGCVVGDVDGDGTPELLVRPYDDGPLRVVACSDGHELLRIPQVFASPCIRLFSPGDCDGDGSPEVAVLTGRLAGVFLTVLRACDGQRAFGGDEPFQDLLCEPGRADWDGDGRDDLVVTRNIWKPDVAPRALWRDGTVEILDGLSGRVLRTFDGTILP